MKEKKLKIPKFIECDLLDIDRLSKTIETIIVENGPIQVLVNNAANVKIEITSGQWKFTDYLLLLKLKDGWKIINKSYTRERR